MSNQEKLEASVESENTGFWISDGYFYGPINSGRYRLTKNRNIIGPGTQGHIVSKDGKILDPQGNETGYFFDNLLHVLGPEYGTLPWMKEKAKLPKQKQETPEDYGMKINQI